MKKALFLTAALVSVLLPPAAAQQLNIYGSTWETQFSGKGGGSRTLAPPSGTDATLASIIARERSDDPCHLETTFRDINTNATVHTAKFTECANSGDKRDGKKGSEERVAASEVTYADFWPVAARICHNKDGDKMKGMALIFRRKSCILGEATFQTKDEECKMVKVNGSDQQLCADTKVITHTCDEPLAESTAWFERTNCVGDHDYRAGPDEDWKREVRCPADKIATGLVLSTRDGGSDREMIDGIALQCRSVLEAFSGHGAGAVRAD